MTLEAIVDTTSSVIVGAAAIVTSFTAITGINAWRREYIGKRRVDLAEEVLSLFYEAKDALSAMRSPLGFEGEGTTREASDGESQQQKEIRDQAYVIVERYQKRQDTFNRLHTLRYRFMAQNGPDAGKPFTELHQLLNEVLLFSRKVVRLWERQGRTPMTEAEHAKHLENLEEAEAVFWEGLKDPDPIAQRMDDIITNIEGICSSIIDKRRSSTSAG